MSDQQEVMTSIPEAEAPERPGREDAPASGEAPEASEAEGAAGAEAERPVRPREVLKGIHPELLCQCEECAPDFVELQWFSPEEKRKVKGEIMLYCQNSGRKYFSPATALHTWVADNPTAQTRRSRAEA